MAKRKLSSSEVARLVHGLDAFDEMDDGTSDDRAQPYRLGGADATTVADLHALRMINERLCRIGRRVFLPMLRMQPRLSAFPPEIRTFDDYRDSLENFVSLTVSRIPELRGTQLMVIPPAFVSLLTDAFFGGGLRRSVIGRNEFTATEQRVIEKVTTGLNDALQLAWRDLTALSFVPASREENLQFASFVDGKDPVVVCSFMVQLPGTDPEMFDILYPLQTLKPIIAQLRSRMQSDVVDDDETWRAQLRKAILSVPLPLSVQLCETRAPLGQIRRMQPGDVLPATIPPHVTLKLGGTVLAEADLGEVGGHLALRLTSPPFDQSRTKP